MGKYIKVMFETIWNHPDQDQPRIPEEQFGYAKRLQKKATVTPICTMRDSLRSTMTAMKIYDLRAYAPVFDAGVLGHSHEWIDELLKLELWNAVKSLYWTESTHIYKQ